MGCLMPSKKTMKTPKIWRFFKDEFPFFFSISSFSRCEFFWRVHILTYIFKYNTNISNRSHCTKGDVVLVVYGYFVILLCRYLMLQLDSQKDLPNEKLEASRAYDLIWTHFCDLLKGLKLYK